MAVHRNGNPVDSSVGSRYLKVKDEGVDDAGIPNLDGQLLQDLRWLDHLVLFLAVHAHECLRQPVSFDRQLPVRCLHGIVQDHDGVIAQVFLESGQAVGRGGEEARKRGRNDQHIIDDTNF